MGLIIESTQDPVPKFDETMFPCDRGVWRSVSISVFQSLSVCDRLIDVATDPEHFERRSRRGAGTEYNDAAGRTPADAVTSDLGGQTLAPGCTRRTPR